MRFLLAIPEMRALAISMAAIFVPMAMCTSTAQESGISGYGVALPVTPICVPGINDVRTGRGVEQHSFKHPQTGLALRVSVLHPQIVRIEYSPTGEFPALPSYGVSPQFKPAAGKVSGEETPDAYILKTRFLHLLIDKQTFATALFTAQGKLICKDTAPPTFSALDKDGKYSVQITKSIHETDCIFGLGDKPCQLNLRGKKVEMWGTDSYQYGANTDPLYKNIPFFLTVNEKYHYGIFFDNTGRTNFDFGKSTPGTAVISAPTAPIDYYLICAVSPIETVALYTSLTGTPAIPPLWALGYHQSKYSYYPDTALLEMAQTMREKKFPCDVIHLDIHYLQEREGFRWCGKSFPNPERLHQDLTVLGFKTVAISNPGIKIAEDSPIWQEGKKEGHFCLMPDGSLAQGKVWPGQCMFPDFTNPRTREWWGKLLNTHILSKGVSGIWNDMNEPVVMASKTLTLPGDTQHHYDGSPTNHLMAHNIYGHCMNFAAYKGLLNHDTAKRPYLLTRSGYAGLQRVACTWTGDNTATWEHIGIANTQCQRLAASGISFAGSDAGGFLGSPSPELFCRWMQMAAFHVFFRSHNSEEAPPQEPWCFGDEVTSHVRAAINTRYRLLPYFYTEFYRYSTMGTPIIRSLALQCHEIKETHGRTNEFFVGDNLYIVPIVQKESKGTNLYLPPGIWYDYHTGTSMEQTKQEVWVDCDLSHIPVYVHGGALIPHWPLQQFVGEIATPPVTLVGYWAAKTTRTSYLYEDTGNGHTHTQLGNFLFYTFTYESTDNSLSITITHTGKGNPADFSSQHILTLHALPLTQQKSAQSLTVRLNDKPVPASSFTITPSPKVGSTISLPLPTNCSKIEISW